LGRPAIAVLATVVFAVVVAALALSANGPRSDPQNCCVLCVVVGTNLKRESDGFLELTRRNGDELLASLSAQQRTLRLSNPLALRGPAAPPQRRCANDERLHWS